MGTEVFVYCAFYLYRVSDENVQRFLRISNEASDLYRRHGAVDSAMQRVTDANSKYGCLGLSDLIHARPGEQLFVGIDSFADAAEFQRLMKEIDSDPRIGELYQEIMQVIDFSKIIRWEAEQNVGGWRA